MGAPLLLVIGLGRRVGRKAEGAEVHWRAASGERGFGPSGQEEGEEEFCFFIFLFSISIYFIPKPFSKPF